ncbi:Leucine-rich repeat, typical subtype [Parasponia andersonii]|uniref:Leucine-rich repeat, typical subtype n=1 Tax=Parasponia andersonii TaxID=3476 RepID=A0A2P5DHC6_PARAD|nr:Leucine-rich repeat, typical subtype [Parasponia andersonii]
MASLSFFLVGFLVLASEASSLQKNSDGFEMEMEKEELLGLFDVMDALLDDPDWAKTHPHPCSETPWPGVQCEIGQDPPFFFHVTKIHIGPDILNPPCKISARVSDSLVKLPFLKTFSIFNCFLTSQVTLSSALFGSLSSLEHLALESNPALSGGIPSSLAKVASLRVLRLSQNSLEGEIPKEFGEMVILEQLDLSYNNLSGEVPEEIGGMENLTILDLSWNSLEGQLPSAWGQLELLQKVDLGSNKLVGSIPPDFGKLKRLVLLDLSNNLLNGPIPETLSGLDNLEYLLADHNPLNTGIPQFIGRLKKLQTMSFSGCGLTGTLPNSLIPLKHLSSLSLDNNSLTGIIPPNLGTIPSLDQLNLSYNKLSGEVLLPEDFIERLGKRLDIRGNNGLCTSSQLNQRKVSLYLEAPVCLHETTEPRNGNTLAWQHSNESERAKPSEDRLKESSNGSIVASKSLSFTYFFSEFLSVNILLFLKVI